MKTDVAILAGGCFWGVQELIRKLNGVVSTGVGYTGGRNDNPTYQHHPGHAEAVKVVYSPDKLSYRKLLEYFFSIHNPTTILRQGNDIFSYPYRNLLITRLAHTCFIGCLAACILDQILAVASDIACLVV